MSQLPIFHHPRGGDEIYIYGYVASGYIAGRGGGTGRGKRDKGTKNVVSLYDMKRLSLLLLLAAGLLTAAKPAFAQGNALTYLENQIRSGVLKGAAVGFLATDAQGKVIASLARPCTPWVPTTVSRPAWVTPGPSWKMAPFRETCTSSAAETPPWEPETTSASRPTPSSGAGKRSWPTKASPASPAASSAMEGPGKAIWKTVPGPMTIPAPTMAPAPAPFASTRTPPTGM